jgi:ABC-type Zn uptake system ZnuABC Zn-binding protein ZnuA
MRASAPALVRVVAVVTLAGTIAAAPVAAALQDEPAPLVVCATIPDLADLASEIGGEHVTASSFAGGPQDPHFLEARPSFLRDLSKADLFCQVGLELEVGWAPVLLRNARNPEILAGGRGHFDASTVVAVQRSAGPVDRSQGDVHPLGNPHFLLDPLNGWRVARALRDRFSELRPRAKDSFDRRYGDFLGRLARRLLGETLALEYEDETEKLLDLLERGGADRFLEFLESQGQRESLGGWLRELETLRAMVVVADHNLWPYFARRFGFKVAGYLEPKPGLAPTTRHLSELIRRMRAGSIRVILAAPYFNPRHAEFVAKHTDAVIVELAHQSGARSGTDTYLDTIDYNVRQLVTAARKVRAAATVGGSTP